MEGLPDAEQQTLRAPCFVAPAPGWLHTRSGALVLGQALGPIRSAGSPIANEHADLRIYMHQRNALYSAPIRATSVKRAHEPDPVTMRAAGLG